MKNIAKFRKTAAAIIFAMAVAFTGCGNDSGEISSEGNEGGREEEQQTTAENTSDRNSSGEGEGNEAYLDGIQALDYVNLGNYKGIEVVQEKPEITEEYRDSYIDYLLCFNPDRGVIEGDTVNIDYVGTLDGVAFDGGTASGQDLTIGSGRFVPGFEEGLIGAQIGETVEVPLTFPENYHEGLAGKDVIFTVTINSIRATEPQELTDAYVEKLNLGLHTVDEYRQYAYDVLYEDAMAAYEEQVENEVLAVALEDCEFTEEPPQAMVDRHVKILSSNLASQAAGYGLTLSQLMELYYGMDEQAYQEEFQNQAVEYAKQQIMIKAVAETEGLQVTEEEFQKELESLLEDSGYETVEELKDVLDVEGYKEYMLSMKVLDLLRENAIVKEE